MTGIQIRHADDAKELTLANGLALSRRLIGPSRGSERVAVDLVTLFAGYDLPSRYESSDESIYVLEGEAEIEFGGGWQRLKPGSVIFVPQNTEYHWKVIGEAIRLLVVFAPPL